MLYHPHLFESGAQLRLRASAHGQLHTIRSSNIAIAAPDGTRPRAVVRVVLLIVPRVFDRSLCDKGCLGLAPIILLGFSRTVCPELEDADALPQKPDDLIAVKAVTRRRVANTPVFLEKKGPGRDRSVRRRPGRGKALRPIADDGK